ncbi:hypothetical protein [Brevibacterium litoralis]|uniref:hypothetical protein n=1 Tax=Brevibacterium litoralis TaxID=3138935 RepID=UPI0032EF573C
MSRDNTARVPTRPAPRVRSADPGRLTGAGVRRLRLVVPDLARSRAPFSLVVVGLLALGLVGVLLLNILISHTTYRVEELSATHEGLVVERDSLAEDVSYRESPQNIAAAAEDQGMTRDTSPQYIRLSDGTVLSPGEVPGRETADRSAVPGPRADARDAVRPNLRSDEVLPAVGGSGTTLPSPALRTPE